MKKQMTKIVMMLSLVIGLSAGVAKAQIDVGFYTGVETAPGTCEASTFGCYGNTFALNSYDDWTIYRLTLSEDEPYRFGSFVEEPKGGKFCTDTANVNLPSAASVTKTFIKGKGETPSKVDLKVGSKIDDTSVRGSNGNWSGFTNAFNGSSFIKATWTMIIPKPSGADCSGYNGTTILIQYS